MPERQSQVAQSELMNPRAVAAAVTSDHTQVKLQAETDTALFDRVISGLLQEFER